MQWYNLMPLVSCHAKTSSSVASLFWLSWLNKCSDAIHEAIGITWCWCWCQWHNMAKISCSISLWSSWPNKGNGANDDIVSIMWHWYQHQWHYVIKKVMLHIVSIILTLWIQWCYWQCLWHHMMLMLVPTVSNDWKSHVTSHFNHLEVINAVVLLMIASVLCDTKCWHHMNQKSQVVPCFYHLDLTNKMVPLTIPSVSWDTHTDLNSVIWPKQLCHTLFQLSLPNEQMVPLMIQLASHGSNAITNDIAWQKMSCFTSFWTLWHNKCNCAIDNTIGITRICLDIV